MLPSYAPVSFSLSVLSSVYFEILKKKGAVSLPMKALSLAC